MECSFLFYFPSSLFLFLHDFFNTFEPSLYTTSRWLAKLQKLNRNLMTMMNRPR